MPVFPYDFQSENAEALISTALCLGEGESVKPPASSSAENKKPAEAGFFKTIPTSCR
jgi:hypothetical protein